LPALLAALERDVVLATGRTVRVRAVRASDVAGLRSFYDHLSEKSSYYRWFGLRPAIPDEEMSRSALQDVRGHVALIAESGSEVIGIAEYFGRPGGEEAELGLAVADEHQHEGVATILLEDLAVVARAAGLRRLVAVVLPANTAMTAVFRTVGLVNRAWFDGGVIRVELDLTTDDLLQDHADLRDWNAVVRSLQPVVRPRHVVVIGASRRASSPGRRILAKLAATFAGKVSVVHPSGERIAGVESVRSLVDLSADVPDLAVVAVPAAAVVSVVDECGRIGIPAAVIISAGFAERDSDGTTGQDDLLAAARRHGMRIIGPNCLGVVSTSVGLDATFSDLEFRPGGIAIATQSGGVGLVVAAEAARREVGISSFVSMGNKADVSGNDLLRLWADDEASRVILLYLESFGDPVRFARVARAVSRRKPVIALKSGRSAPGRRGARSHTAAIASDDAAVDALFRHTGVLRANSLEELIDAGLLLERQPTPAGKRVAVVGNAGGPLILGADAADAAGLEVPELSAALQTRLAELEPTAAAVANPVDLSATVAPDRLAAVVEAVASSSEVDACIVVWVDVDGRASDVEGALAHLDDVGVTLAMSRMGGGTSAGVIATAESHVPRFPSPERAAVAVGLAARRGAWLSSIEADDAAPGDEDLADALAVARRIVRQHDEGADATPPLSDRTGHRWVSPSAAFETLAVVGVPIAPWQYVRSGAECQRAAKVVGTPCVIKADVTEVLHKTDAGAVVMDVDSPEEASGVYTSFEDRFGDRLVGALVQAQAGRGIELLVGATRSAGTGPVIVVGAGGIEAELRNDNAVLAAPATIGEIRRAVEGLRLAPLFHGFRGRPEVSVDPVIEAIHRVSLLVAAAPEIVELDVNPLIVDASGCLAVDARMAIDDSARPIRPLRGLRGR
jgi:acyl-CoA synthetase (NDP forming)/RimJ/RimL family protein N-acetyltransferase